MDFIFMLTRQDQTVEDCLEVLDLIIPAGLTHIGFKDVGVAPAVLEQLTKRIKDYGATSYIEVVSTTPESVERSLTVARDLGVDCILGGTDITLAQQILGEKIANYYPFPGRPHGHPTKLAGTAQDIAEDCKRYLDAGCPGVDLLAFRATEDAPLALITAARKALGPDKRLIIAGSIDSRERIAEIRHAGADAYTIGSALFDGSIAPRKGSLAGMIRDILAISKVEGAAEKVV